MKHFLAPRQDGTIGRYFGAVIHGVQYGVDDTRSADALVYLSPRARIQQTIVEWSVAILIIGGFVALFWFPWYTPIITIAVSYFLFRFNASSAAASVAKLAEKNPAILEKLVELQIIRSIESMRPDAPAGDQSLVDS